MKTKTITKASQIKKGVELFYPPVPERWYKVERKKRGKNIWRVSGLLADHEYNGEGLRGLGYDWTLKELKETFKIKIKS